MRLLKKFRYLVLLSPLLLSAQEVEEEVAVPEQGGTASNSAAYATEKAEMIQLLKRDVEPNLPQADARKIRQNVMRLGSYNATWSSEAMELLLANSALAELFAYDYSRIHNARLNRQILKFLSRLENYQYPRAALFFSEDFLRDRKASSDYLKLIQNIVSRHPQVFEDYFLWLFSPAARDINFVQRLNFLRASCRAGANFSVDLRSQIDTWAGQSQDLWASVFLEEVRSCLKGL